MRNRNRWEPKGMAASRRRRQSGHEIMEFALVLLVFIPLTFGTFITGLNVIRSIQANHIVRDIADMYIHGADFSSYSMQVVAQRLAAGMDLRIGSSYSGNAADNLGNGGRGIVWVSKVMWVGAENEPTCQGAGQQTCTNANKFVFLERIRFGNGSLEAQYPSSLGHPSANRNNYGLITDDTATDPDVQIPGASQASMQATWQTSANGRTPLSDGQVVYVAEAFFESPDLNSGGFPGVGVYARWFF